MDQITRRPRRTARDLDPTEVAALTELWREELLRGWIPTPSDIADAVGMLRHR